jgi:hypothetical protein
MLKDASGSKDKMLKGYLPFFDHRQSIVKNCG